MARRRRNDAARAAMDAARLSLSAAQTAAAAAQTVALRAPLFGRGVATDPEFARMVTEKAVAASLAGTAMLGHMPGLWRLWLGAATAPWLFAGASARAASAALAPYRRATRANAKRLSAKRRMS